LTCLIFNSMLCTGQCAKYTMKANDAALYENLILRMANGDNNAFAELYRHTYTAVYGFALSIMRNKPDAEDVMHDTYIRVYNAAAGYQPMGKPLQWILTIVRNLCYNRIRSGKLCDDIDEYREVIGAGGDEISDRLLLKDALEVLDFDERQIVIMHAMTGLKHREIAEILAMPTGTVTSKYKRALQKMRSAIDGRTE